jgi:hypothetical protein
VLLVRKVIVGIAIALSNDTRESVRRESGFVQVSFPETGDIAHGAKTRLAGGLKSDHGKTGRSKQYVRNVTRYGHSHTFISVYLLTDATLCVTLRT